MRRFRRSSFRGHAGADAGAPNPEDSRQRRSRSCLAEPGLRSQVGRFCFPNARGGSQPPGVTFSMAEKNKSTSKHQATAFERVQLARHPERPYTLDFIEPLFEAFT